MNAIKTTLILSFALLLNACATTVNLTPQARAKVHNVAIHPQVKMPAGMYYYGTAMTVGSMFGILGDVIGVAKTEQDASLFMKFMKKNKINVADIVRTQLTKQMTEHTPFRIVTKNPDATLYITVTLYGLAIPQGFSHVYKPVLSVIAVLVNKQHQVIWQNRAETLAWSNLPDYSTQAYLRDPNLLRKGFTLAADKVGRELAIKMNQ